VHEPSGIGGTDVHARALSNCLKSLKDGQVSS
jgi:hypothetical protein